MSTSKRTTKATIASIALIGILALYASGLAMTFLTSSIHKAFASSSSDGSNSTAGGESNKINKNDEQQILNGVRQCFDNSSDNRDLEKCLGDAIENGITQSDHDQSSRSSNSDNSSSSE
jgi:hypothetical protein